MLLAADKTKGKITLANKSQSDKYEWILLLMRNICVLVVCVNAESTCSGSCHSVFFFGLVPNISILFIGTPFIVCLSYIEVDASGIAFLLVFFVFDLFNQFNQFFSTLFISFIFLSRSFLSVLRSCTLILAFRY